MSAENPKPETCTVEDCPEAPRGSNGVSLWHDRKPGCTNTSAPMPVPSDVDDLRDREDTKVGGRLWSEMWHTMNRIDCGAVSEELLDRYAAALLREVVGPELARRDADQAEAVLHVARQLVDEQAKTARLSAGVRKMARRVWEQRWATIAVRENLAREVEYRRACNREGNKQRDRLSAALRDMARRVTKQRRKYWIVRRHHFATVRALAHHVVERDRLAAENQQLRQAGQPQHIASITQRADGTWAVLCHSCSNAAQDYVRCEHLDTLDFPVSFPNQFAPQARVRVMKCHGTVVGMDEPTVTVQLDGAPAARFAVRFVHPLTEVPAERWDGAGC